jgi:hypothetical protein
MQFEIIQPHYLMSLCDNDTQFMCKMYEAFLQQNTNVQEQLQECIIHFDVIRAKKIIHTLKSSFSILGVDVCKTEIEITESDSFLSIKKKEFIRIIKKILFVYIQMEKEYTIFIQNLSKT